MQIQRIKTSWMWFGIGKLITHPNDRFLKVLNLPFGTVSISWHVIIYATHGWTDDEDAFIVFHSELVL